MFANLALHLRYALVIVLVVVLVILMSKWTGSSSSTLTVVTQASARNAAEQLVQQSQEMMGGVETAASPVEALVQAAYADAYLAAAEQVAGSDAKSLQIPGLRAKVQTAQHALWEHVKA